MQRGATSDQYLLFRSRSCLGALALADVREVMRPLPVERVAGTPCFVKGVAIVRGAPAPVVDAASLLSGEADEAAASPATRFVALKVGARTVCLAVDAVLDVRTLQRDDLQHSPPLLRQSGGELLPLIGALDQDLLIVLNAARLVPESVWTSIQHPATSA